MNYKYPNFNFDEWFHDYIIMISPHNDELLITTKLLEAKNEFFWQIHHKNDEDDNLCDEYLKSLMAFNNFMKFISNEDNEFQSIVKYVIFNLYTGDRSIYNGSFNSVLFNRRYKEIVELWKENKRVWLGEGDEGWYGPQLVEKIYNFLVKHKISFTND